MNEAFIPPFLSSIHETENLFRSEAASHAVSNTKDGKSAKSMAVSSLDEEAYEGNSFRKITDSSEVTADYAKFPRNTSDTERSHVKGAEHNNELHINFPQKCENVKSSVPCSLPINNLAGHSSTTANSLPQSNVMNYKTNFEKSSEDGIGKKTAVNRTSSSADACYRYDPGSGSGTSSRMCGYEVGEVLNESASKTLSNGTRLQHVDMRLQFEHTDDSYRPTDCVMEVCARHLEMDSLFNPILFRQLLSSYSGLNISGFSSTHDVECHYKSEGGTDTEASTGTVEKCGFGGAATLVNVTRTKCLMYSPKEGTYIRNDRLCVNSNSGDCDVNRGKIKETEASINGTSEIT